MKQSRRKELATLAKIINQHYRAATGHARAATLDAIEVGRLLIVAKGRCQHGEWKLFLKERFEGSQRRAQEFMDLARSWLVISKSADSAHLTIDKALKLAKRVRCDQKRDKRRADALAYAKANHAPDDQNVIHGDLGLLADRLEDDSVALFLTDPPYPKDDAGLYGRLAELAAAKLKPGGLCVAYVGHHIVPQVIAAMGEHLDYWWFCAIKLNGGSQVIWTRNLQARWRPVIVYAKPPASKASVQFDDFVANDKPDKRFHKWGQGVKGFLYYIEHLTNAGDLVVEPFCGGGSVPVACKLSGRRWLATEIDAESVAIARQRICETEVSDELGNEGATT